MRYKFEVERHPTNPGDEPHLFAYEAPKDSDAKQDPVWDSSEAGKGEMLLSPGEFRALQWVFTKPGTYLLWVHLLGEVKKPGVEENWKPISANDTETSEVYRYTFQVGSTLNETEPPIFGVNRSVAENSFGGTKVGDPIPVYNAEAPVLYYALTGPGHSNFELASSTSTEPHAVQIVVADDATLDYEDEEKRSYELFLTVTDRVDHEDNFDPYPDDVLIVRINLEDREPGLKLHSDRGNVLAVGETTNLVVRYEPTAEWRGQTPTYEWGEQFLTDDGRFDWRILHSGTERTWPVPQSSAPHKRYRVSITWPNEDQPLRPIIVNSNEVQIFWGDAE